MNKANSDYFKALKNRDSRDRFLFEKKKKEKMLTAKLQQEKA
jgi:hypothetical protein